MSHTLRSVLFLFPVQALITAALLWWGICTVRARRGQLLMTAVSVAWVVVQLRHELVL